VTELTRDILADHAAGLKPADLARKYKKTPDAIHSLLKKHRKKKTPRWEDDPFLDEMLHYFFEGLDPDPDEPNAETLDRSELLEQLIRGDGQFQGVDQMGSEVI